MKSIKTFRFSLILSGLIPFLTLSSAFADITYVFSPSPSGGVNVVGSGSGVATRPEGIASSDWDVENFQTNFMKIASGAVIGADSESGVFTNVTTGISEQIITFGIDEDGAPALDNDIDFDTENVLTFAFGHEYTFSLMASFEPSTLTMHDLVKGTHIDLGRTNPDLPFIAEEAFGLTIVKVVPEPTSLVLAIGSVAALSMLTLLRS